MSGTLKSNLTMANQLKVRFKGLTLLSLDNGFPNLIRKLSLSSCVREDNILLDEQPLSMESGLTIAKIKKVLCRVNDTVTQGLS